ncbi:sodium- and chloride-dependent glycine transporter 2-like [Paramacrobiotus metropolitanus]|uniref:sodium- and chloride-dependent glycine transporter 2-like n=1 Tax=Paramacrobiotus metropolitanus TaxID=2943436 RepID=UPI002445C61C|nr:sodium- and chloride-dependent glycine transporter 2-like [Paramacrobiotus metropolitanus]XP_055329334.1 sodium- and chloride-dependent glycine transporter 2-like [Paramacrobiotus metropolitanus]
MPKKTSIEITTTEAPVEKRDAEGFHDNTVSTRTGDANTPERGQWGNKAEFVLSCISLSVGLGNVWRFPYLAYANGGGAFLIPYICVLFLVGKPMYFMEIALGQHEATGPVKVWKRIVPLAKGIGAAQVVVCMCVAIFYVIIMSWTMFYFWATLISAFRNEAVPWIHFCKSDWAHKETCVPPGSVAGGEQWIHDFDNPNVLHPIIPFPVEKNLKYSSASQQYFDRYVLVKYDQGSPDPHGLENLGSISLELLGCLALSWIIVFFSLVKGVKSSGKVVYVTSTLPFIVLIILLGNGAAQDGAVDGILYFIVPKFDKLLNIQTWKAAAEQMFFSLSVAFGSLTMLGSYNKFNNNCYQDGLIVSVLDTVTSVTSGLAMFSVLGFLANQRGVGIEHVVDSGPGLAFVTFPESLNNMQPPHLWAILFFVMLYTLGLGSEIGLLEMAFTFLCDKFPSLREKKPLVVAIGCTICFLIGLAFITQGGTDLFDIFNEYAGGISVLFMATFEIICVMWVYGLKRFISDLKEMMGKSGDMSYYWRTAWSVLSPVTLLFILIVSLVQYRTLYEATNKRLPVWADGIGWTLAGLAIIQLPVWAIIVVWKSKGDTLGEKFKQSLWPDYIMEPQMPAEVVQMGTIPRAKLKPTSSDGSLNDKPPAYTNRAYDKRE